MGKWPSEPLSNFSRLLACFAGHNPMARAGAATKCRLSLGAGADNAVLCPKADYHRLSGSAGFGLRALPPWFLIFDYVRNHWVHW